MEYAVITAQRSLDLGENYTPVRVGNIQVGLQAVNGDVAEIEVQGPQGVNRLEIPVGTAAAVQGYTFINLDTNVFMPGEKKKPRRFLFFGGEAEHPKGMMEAELDIRWGDQAMQVASPEKDQAYDFILVRQYELVHDRPMTYRNQDVLKFGELKISVGEKVEPGSRNFENPRYAPLIVQVDGEDEEEWQVRINNKYHRYGDYRLKITMADFENGWYQAYGLSLVKGKPKGEVDETEQEYADGIVDEAFTPQHYGTSESRLEQAKNDPNEIILKAGESGNVGAVSLKIVEMKPGTAKVMMLSPRVKVTTLRHGDVYDFVRWDVSLVGVYGDKAIIRVTQDKQ